MTPWLDVARDEICRLRDTSDAALLLYLGDAGPKEPLTPPRFFQWPWGKFDKFITAVIPAKDLRALIRVKGDGERFGHGRRLMSDESFTSRPS